MLVLSGLDTGGEKRVAWFIRLSLHFWGAALFTWLFIRLSRGAPLSISLTELTPVLIVYMIFMSVQTLRRL
ncbi:MAG TPA: hypothetical protein VKQ54_10390 [Caulobacteraceae bacterium]|nr:hypothetical protein [Caulobacteraceae bacterium]